MKFNREIEEHVPGAMVDQEYEATEVDYLSDILGTLESIEAHMERLGNSIEEMAQMQADFYSEIMRRTATQKIMPEIDRD